MDLEHRRLRALRLEAAAEQAEVEQSTSELEASRRSMVDVFFELGNAGSEIVCETLAGSVRGRVVHVGSELVRVVGVDETAIDVALHHVHGVRTVAVGRPSAVSSGHPSTVVARCRELANSGIRVELASPVAVPMRGMITVAGDHHVEGEGATGIWFVPVDSVCLIREI